MSYQNTNLHSQVSLKSEVPNTISLTIPMDSNILLAIQNLVQSEHQKQASSKPVVTKPKQNFTTPPQQPQKTVTFDERIEKVFIWEDYSNSSFSPNSPSRDAISNSTSTTQTDKKNRNKRGREVGRNDENPSPTKQLRSITPPTETNVIYDSKWYSDLSLSFCLTMQDYQDVAVQYVMHLVQQQQQQLPKQNENDSTPAMEPIHSLEKVTEEPTCVAATENKNIVKEDVTFLSDDVLAQEQSEECITDFNRRGSVSEFRRNSISDLLFNRRGSLDLLFGDGFISKSRRNSIDFASVLLLQ